jgi:hypothetical protein
VKKIKNTGRIAKRILRNEPRRQNIPRTSNEEIGGKYKTVTGCVAKYLTRRRRRRRFLKIS